MISLFQKLERFMGLKKQKRWTPVIFFITGTASLIWLLIRVIPKPSRLQYPCMKATMPVAFSFIAYITSITGFTFFTRKTFHLFKKGNYGFATVVLMLVIVLGIYGMTVNQLEARANTSTDKAFSDPLGANVPIGEPKGIIPGRVVWIWNPDATNENCTNSNHSSAYWVDTNTNQDVVDQMFSQGIKEVTGMVTDSAAWEAIFRYFNMNHGKGDTGYVAGETIFIKINAVTAWSGAWPNGDMPSNIPIEFDTSPQTILAMLRQLIHVAGVPQENIYVGDPMADIWNTLYNKFYAEFPNVNYCSQRDITGRYRINPGSEGIHYSDQGTVITALTGHNFFTEMLEADYLLNIPAMKGHRWGGTTFFAKNHFGSNTSDHSWELHKGLMKPDNDPLRDEYNMYRVQVDIMACKYLGGNTLLYFMDALWSTSYEHQKPQKFQTWPFNDNWCSSILFSLDPVAIESVCLDILQKEFVTEEYIDGWDAPATDRWVFVQYPAVDDYLHQAADSTWWPEDINYDPDQTGTPISSLGVHEHWNNDTLMQYSVNLGTGNGIDLVKIFPENLPSLVNPLPAIENLKILPNPSNGHTAICLNLNNVSNVTVDIFSTDGSLVKRAVENARGDNKMQVDLDMSNLTDGIYVCRITIKNIKGSYILSEKVQLIR